MLNRSFLITAGATLLFAAGPVLAGGDANAPAPFNISSAQDFAQQAAAVRSGIQPDGEYAGLSGDALLNWIDDITASAKSAVLKSAKDDPQPQS